MLRLVPESTMLCFARIILQRAKCAIALRTMHELLGANSTMYIGHYLGFAASWAIVYHVNSW